MSTSEDILLRLINGKTTVKANVGTFVSATSTGCTVDVGGGRVPARFGSGYLPETGESVNVWFIDDAVFVMGPTSTKPAQGTVVSVASSLVTLSTAFGNVTAPFAGSTPSAGQVMALRWHGGPFAMGVASVVPAPVDPPDPPKPPASTSTHRDVFSAIDAGSFNRYGWQQAQVWASDSYQGAWFYGTKVADTVPSSATIQRVELYLSPQQVYGAAPNFALHTSASKPAGAPTYSATQAIAAASGWVTLPAAWGDSLKNGGSYRGVGVNHGGYNIFRSLAQDGLSGTLRITSIY